jgi:hypothetical protein
MEHVILEREFDPPLSPDDFLAMAMDAAGCLDTYRVTWCESLLALKGNRLLCRFQAPDIESVRMVVRDTQASAKVAWSGTVHDTGRAGKASVVVARRFDGPITLEELQAREDAHAWCLEQHQVTFLRTFFSADRKRMICLYQAPDAESVRLAQRQAGMPVENVWPCQPYDRAGLQAGLAS